ncbi:hypothetical protein BT96DRAFT_984242 [Gymnopus androsaceus JB14]|uniref:Uncharacterized protein n=1 Tax=Gymnopus androsaceus JB14 TaxID=1447944 RepID=A0A6A4IJZ3_9AGAR|nr:hypothetical protein BT96DRAFT_984242 [Gymnopus androsaceus JB14]
MSSLHLCLLPWLQALQTLTNRTMAGMSALTDSSSQTDSVIHGEKRQFRQTGVDVASTLEQPIAIGDGFHCSDLITDNGLVDTTVLAVQTKALTFMKTWLAEWQAPPASPKRDVPQSRKVEINSRVFRA